MGQQIELPPGLTFLTLPLEIRLEIYRYLLAVPTNPVNTPTNLVSIRDYHLYEVQPAPEGAASYMLSFINTTDLTTRQRRAVYKIRTDRFRARCMDATYMCLNKPQLHPSILLTNHQIYSEAYKILYTSYTFDFDTNIEACVPFLSDLTPAARAAVHSLSIVKRALPYDKEFDCAEWTTMCAYLACNLSLRRLQLGVVAGKPLSKGWDDVAPFEHDEFRTVLRKPEMSWVNDLAAIRGLQEVDTRAHVEHCPPPTASSAMEFFVTFSASVEDGFAKYLRGRMVAAAA